MRTALLLLLAFTVPALASQTVWKWVDDKGVTHYSDRPVPGATRMELRTGSRSDSPQTTPAVPTPEPAAAAQQDSGPPYRNFEIWKPAPDEVIINTGGVVTVNVRVEPALKPGHEISIYLDNQLVENTQSDGSSFQLTEVPRGLHTVVATITDLRGRRLQETGGVPFMVRQESIAQPPVGPALRPPPKPRGGGGAANKLRTRQPSYADLNGPRPPIDPATNAPVKPKPEPRRKGPKPGG